MMKKLLTLLSVLVMAGCGSSGYGNMRSTPDYAAPSAPAAAAPRPLYEAYPGQPQGTMAHPAAPYGTAQQGYGTQAAPGYGTPPYGAQGYGAQGYGAPGHHAAPPPGAQQDGAFSAVIGHNAGAASQTHGYTAPATGTAAAMPSAAQDLPPVKVALLAPLSGQQAELGQAMLQAAQLALFDMGYQSFELMPRDTKGSAEGAREAAQSAANSGAQLILGPLFSYEVRAAQEITGRYNLNMIAFSTDWTLAGGNTYIMGFLPFGQVQRIVDYAGRRGMGRVGVLAPDNDYGNAVVAALNNAAQRGGVMPAEIVRFPANATDLSDVVRRFSRYDQRGGGTPGQGRPVAPPPFDAVLLPVGGEQARAIGNLLNFYDMDPAAVRRLGTGLWDDPVLAADPALAGAWFAASAPDARRGFESRYAELYGHRPPRLSTLAYDATALAAVLARNGFQTTGRPAFDRAALTNPNGFAGLDGVFRFRPDGLVERGTAVLEFRDAGIRVLDPAPATFQRYAGQ